MSHELDSEIATPGTAAMATANVNANSETSISGSEDDNNNNNISLPLQQPSTPPSEGNKPSWLSQEEEDTIVIEEEEEELPMKKGWGGQTTNSNNDNNNVNSFNTAAEARNNQQQQQQQQQQLGSKPRLTNMSLLSSAVAHATLERCLLGVNGGGNVNDETESKDENVNVNNANNDYSKQCKRGHVIDILELRRLSSRGVPDEPPETRSRAVSAPATVSPVIAESTPSHHDRHHQNHQFSNNNNTNHHISSPTGGSNPHRSYRPLVWRVLLGYLPPQTSLWNDVLERDRKLYDTLVGELFSSTCPNPHDVFDEEELRQQAQQRENEVYKNNNERNNNFSINEDDDDGGDAPGTPTESSEEVTAPAAPPTPVTPGLLSARMQREWVRGEGGEESIFNNNRSNSGDKNGVMGSPGGRLSPMCAMNTPRTRIRKEVFKSKEDVIEETEDDDCDGNKEEGPSSSLGEGVGGVNLADRMNESLLLPDEDGDSGDEDNGDKGDEENNTISAGDDGDADDKLTNDDDEGTLSNSPSDSPNSKLTRSISITNTGSEENCEGVELCRQNSQDADNDNDLKAIPPMPPTAEAIDEEENILLLDEIRKDVIRTHPDLRFFLEPNEDLGQKRYAALERILFVWAKLNKGVRYVQGMNEIVGTLYFVLANDSNEDWANQAESDTYFLFNALMVEMRDVFVPDLDDADTGIHGRISNMITLLSLHDPEVRCHLDSVGIDPSFYSVRWLTTLLSREFLLPDTIRLWDSMFASTHKDNFLRYVSVTMVMVIRDQLLTGDFSACLRLLQAYPPTNLDRLLESSRALWIYESQITLACHKGGISLGHALRSIAPPPAIVMAYGLAGGVAPLVREQVRQGAERGLRVARGAANGASSTVASAGRSFFGNAMNFWRAGSGGDNGQRQGKEVRRSKSTM